MNDRLLANGCLGALIGLSKSCRPDITALAVRALGRCGWNGPGANAAISTLARQSWVTWVERLAHEEAVRIPLAGGRGVYPPVRAPRLDSSATL